MDGAAALRLEGLACRRGGRLLFRAVSVDLAAGGSALVSGPNGAGKSSLLRMIAGLLEPFAGRIERTGAVALADEAAALDRDRSLADALGFWARIDGSGSLAVDAALADLGLAHLRDVPVRILSTGQRKRAALARLVAGGTPIWLLDEPGNGLDAASLAALGAVVARHRAAGGIVLAASHQPLPWAAEAEIALAPLAGEAA